MNVFQNKIILTIVVLSIAIQGFSNTIFPKSYKAFLEEECDACGCSNNGGSLGMGGIIDNNFVGVRYLYQQYESKDGIFTDSPKIDESFNTIQFWSRIPIATNLELQVFVPYHAHHRNYVDKTTNITGLGDITLLSNYTILDKKQGDYNEKTEKTSMVNHVVKVGVGVKLPTGKYTQEINNSTNPSFQLGTGSVDYMSNLQYVFKYNDFGVTNYLSYYYKNTNNKKYRFGNQFNFNSTLFYVLKDTKNNVFIPSLGISGEFYNVNKQFNMEVKGSDGHALFSSIGLEYNTNKITFGASGMYPINQNLAQAKVEVKFRTSLYLNYNF
ncbi:hypothetical protein AUW17_00885 [Tenacibaculum dicentrarchi]|nr:hypothetical protein AUW17_00885 [Tenacibaculum dicentrarchi]SOS48109.1 conserved hypothetical protein [Tenacibaculum dicentrarchi]